MTILYTLTSTRPNTGHPFHSKDSSGLPCVTTYQNAIDNLVSANAMTQDVTLSDDQLTRTVVLTFKDLTVFTQYYNLLTDFELGKEFANNIKADGYRHARSLDTIDTPFTATVTYTFPAGSAVDPSLIFDMTYGGYSTVNTTENSIVFTYSIENGIKFDKTIIDDPDVRAPLIANNISRNYVFSV